MVIQSYAHDRVADLFGALRFARVGRAFKEVLARNLSPTRKGAERTLKALVKAEPRRLVGAVAGSVDGLAFVVSAVWYPTSVSLGEEQENCLALLPIGLVIMHDGARIQPCGLPLALISEHAIRRSFERAPIPLSHLVAWLHSGSALDGVLFALSAPLHGGSGASQSYAIPGPDWGPVFLGATRLLASAGVEQRVVDLRTALNRQAIVARQQRAVEAFQEGVRAQDTGYWSSEAYREAWATRGGDRRGQRLLAYGTNEIAGGTVATRFDFLRDEFVSRNLAA